MLLNQLDRIGDWNPQLFRELKGRLQPRSVTIAVLVVLVGQLLLLKIFWDQLPASVSDYSRYCLKGTDSRCLPDGLGAIAINWQLWWGDLFRVMNWIIPILLFVPGVYLLMTDLGQEERRGTLNFLRLTPRSSYSILLGKLLGTPALLYLAVALCLPLQLIAGLGTGASPLFFLSFYSIVGATCFLFYSAGMLCIFVGRSQLLTGAIQLEAGLAALFVFSMVFGLGPAYIVWNVHTVWYPFANYIIGETQGLERITWFDLPLSQPLIAHGFMFLLLGLASHSVWHALDRSFHHPTGTLLSKAHSYFLVFWVEVTMLGILVQDMGETYPTFNLHKLAFLCSANLVGFLILMATLSPQRQALLDWARYRRATTNLRRSWQPLVQDLVWGEKSPMVGAIAVNALIVAGLLIPWILLWPAETHKSAALLGLTLSLGLVLIYAAIAQFLLSMKTKKPFFWAGLGLVATMIAPALLAALLIKGQMTTISAGFILFSPFLWLALETASLPTLPVVLLGILGQWSLGVVLNVRLFQQFKRLGASESKRLLSNSPTLTELS